MFEVPHLQFVYDDVRESFPFTELRGCWINSFILSRTMCPELSSVYSVKIFCLLIYNS